MKVDASLQKLLAREEAERSIQGGGSEGSKESGDVSEADRRELVSCTLLEMDDVSVDQQAAFGLDRDALTEEIQAQHDSIRDAFDGVAVVGMLLDSIQPATFDSSAMSWSEAMFEALKNQEVSPSMKHREFVDALLDASALLGLEPDIEAQFLSFASDFNDPVRLLEFSSGVFLRTIATEHVLDIIKMVEAFDLRTVLRELEEGLDEPQIAQFCAILADRSPEFRKACRDHAKTRAADQLNRGLQVLDTVCLKLKTCPTRELPDLVPKLSTAAQHVVEVFDAHDAPLAARRRAHEVAALVTYHSVDASCPVETAERKLILAGLRYLEDMADMGHGRSPEDLSEELQSSLESIAADLSSASPSQDLLEKLLDLKGVLPAMLAAVSEGHCSPGFDASTELQWLNQQCLEPSLTDTYLKWNEALSA